MKLSKAQCVNLLQVLDNTKYDFPIDSQFRYFLTKNLDILNGIKESLIYELPKNILLKLAEYDKKRQIIIESYGIDHMAKFEELSEDNKNKLTEELNLLNSEYRSELDKKVAHDNGRKLFYSEILNLPLRIIDVKKVPTISKEHEGTHWAIWNILKTLVVEE